MTIYRIPENVKTIIFDIDGTLYTNSAYVFEQVDAQVRHYAELHNMTAQEARDKINIYRRKWSKEHGGKKISLGNTLTAFGVSIDESIRWRNSLLHPECYLHRDEKLMETLRVLSERCRMICVTNNPVDAARQTLAAIGVDGLLTDIIGLDSCKKSKPAKEMLDLAAFQTGAAYSDCLSIGDRYDIDVALPLELGMGGIVVDGVEDIYGLPELIIYNA